MHVLNFFVTFILLKTNTALYFRSDSFLVGKQRWTTSGQFDLLFVLQLLSFSTQCINKAGQFRLKV